MKTTLFALLFSLNAFALVDGLTIPNSHQVDQDGEVFRGKEPGKLLSELSGIGITDVIIFKNDVKGEVVRELAELQELGITSHHIPFKWKEYSTLQIACEQLIDAIKIIKKTKAADKKIFFHCTAGEDRTGTLAGLFRMLTENLDQQTVFKTEMCARGFSDGNKKKPVHVTEAIKKELTPLFIAMSEKIEAGELTYAKLSKSICKTLAIRPTTLDCR